MVEEARGKRFVLSPLRGDCPGRSSVGGAGELFHIQFDVGVSEGDFVFRDFVDRGNILREGGLFHVEFDVGVGQGDFVLRDLVDRGNVLRGDGAGDGDVRRRGDAFAGEEFGVFLEDGGEALDLRLRELVEHGLHVFYEGVGADAVEAFALLGELDERDTAVFRAGDAVDHTVRAEGVQGLRDGGRRQREAVGEILDHREILPSVEREEVVQGAELADGRAAGRGGVVELHDGEADAVGAVHHEHPGGHGLGSAFALLDRQGLGGDAAEIDAAFGAEVFAAGTDHEEVAEDLAELRELVLLQSFLKRFEPAVEVRERLFPFLPAEVGERDADRAAVVGRGCAFQDAGLHVEVDGLRHRTGAEAGVVGEAFDLRRGVGVFQEVSRDRELREGVVAVESEDAPGGAAETVDDEEEFPDRGDCQELFFHDLDLL